MNKSGDKDNWKHIRSDSKIDRSATRRDVYDPSDVITRTFPRRSTISNGIPDFLHTTTVSVLDSVSCKGVSFSSDTYGAIQNFKFLVQIGNF